MAAKVAPRGGAAGLTQRRKTYRILREDTADTLSPLSRTLFELHHEGKSAASSKQLEDVGVTYPEQNLARAMSGLSVAIWVDMITTALTHPEVFEESIHAPPRLLQHLHRAGHGASEVHLQRAASVLRVLLHRVRSHRRPPVQGEYGRPRREGQRD